jgi:hypothetical protein
MEKHNHNWTVYSTSVTPPTILVRCETCHVQGTVYEYTRSEWRTAFYTASGPYPWQDSERVRLPLERVADGE